MNPSDPRSPGADFEPLERLARFSWDWAPVLCKPEHGCTEYHRAWSLVRLLELDGELPVGADSFAQEARVLAEAGRRRVLVSGGADTGLTALVVRAFRMHGAEPEIVFADRCLTPCRQNELFGAAAGFALQAIACDARDIAVAPVDAIVAHSFLQMLPGDSRQPVLDAWARCLAPHGIVWMSTFLAEHEADVGRAKDGGKIEARRKGLEAMLAGRGWSASEAAEVAQGAQRFWQGRASQPPGITEAALASMLSRAGLAIRSLQSLDAVTSPATVGAAATAVRRRRVHVVAVRQ